MSAPHTILDRIDSASSLDEEGLYNTIVSAPFVESDDDGLFFDLGDKRRARVERDEFGDDVPFEPGDDVAVLVEQQLGGQWTGSVQKAQKLAVWRWLESIHQSGQKVDGLIVGENKGGLSVDIGVRAFLPRSQVALHRVDDCSTYVGMEDQFKVVEFDKKRGNIVVSRREVLEERRAAERQQLIDQLAEGQRYDGVVRNLTHYGAFVDIGGIDGLLHVTNMSWGRVNNPSDVLDSGDQIEVVVLEWDPDEQRLGLGRKQLLDDPWSDVDDDYEVGQVIEGTVVSLADFGAFVALEPGLEGLVHVTELSWTRNINHPGQILDDGQDVDVKILSIDTDERRIGLSIKQLEDNPWKVVAENYPADTKLSGPIKNITDFGLFVEVEEGVEGLVHVSDISWTEKIDDPGDHYDVGDEVDVVVLDIDIESQRMNLGIKQLEGDPWKKATERAEPGEKIDVEITKLTDFGAFAEIVEGVEGLIHISELADERIDEPSEVVRPGQTVNALVMSVDNSKRRIGLSLTRDQLPVDDDDLREYADSEGDSTTTLGDLLGEHFPVDGDEDGQD